MIRTSCIVTLLSLYCSVCSYADVCGPGCSWVVTGSEPSGYYPYGNPYENNPMQYPDCAYYPDGTRTNKTVTRACPDPPMYPDKYCATRVSAIVICDTDPDPSDQPRGGRGSGNGGGLNIGPGEICPSNTGSGDPGGYGAGGNH